MQVTSLWPDKAASDDVMHLPLENGISFWYGDKEPPNPHLHPVPYTHTLHPIPYTLHPTPYTLCLVPCALHPTPYTLFLISSHLIASYRISSHRIASHRISSHLISSHLIRCGEKKNANLLRRDTTDKQPVPKSQVR